MAQVSFATTTEDAQVIHKIATRAHEEFGWDRGSTAMDVTATHANGCPLDLERLLAADAFNFAHDLGGIERHLDRTTGELGGFFRPRFAAPSTLDQEAEA